MDARTLVQINLIVQILLLIALAYAGYLARKKQLTRHCLVMRITGGVQIAATLAVARASRNPGRLVSRFRGRYG